MISRRLFNGALLSAFATRALSGCAVVPSRQLDAVTGVDVHAHIFSKDLPLVQGHRYSLDYDAPLNRYVQVLDEHHMSNGVLIQPSFLGTDNSYLLAALRQYPKRLRGIAVIDPARDVTNLEQLDDIGVRGIRLNLINEPDPDFATSAWRNLFPYFRKMRWQIELHAEARRMRTLLPPLLDQQINVVIDHFGRPDPKSGVSDPGFQYILSKGKSRLVWVKISAAYRSSNVDRGVAFGLAAMPLLRESFGADRLLWGSDWPHVGFETVTSYDQQYAYMQEFLPDKSERQVVLVDAPVALYRF